VLAGTIFCFVFVLSVLFFGSTFAEIIWHQLQRRRNWLGSGGKKSALRKLFSPRTGSTPLRKMKR